MANIKSFRTPTDEDWALMKNFMQSEKLTKEDFVVLESQAFGDKLVPNRYIKVQKEFLEVMARDAKKGVSFMLNHNEGNYNSSAMPIGKVFDGYVSKGSQEGEQNSLWLKRYIRRSNENNEGLTNNAIIEKIEDGTLADTSVGFSNNIESIKCSICGKSYYKAAEGCKHWAGREYPIRWDNEGNPTEFKTCYLEYYAPIEENVSNTCLNEDSLVYDGAYPNATLAKQEFSNNTNNYLKNEKLYDKINLSDTNERIYLKNNANIFVQLSTGGKTFVLCNPSDIEKSIKGGSDMSGSEDKTNQVNELVVDNSNILLSGEPAVISLEPEIGNTIEYKLQLTEEDYESLFGADCKDMAIEEIADYAKIGIKYKKELIEEAITCGIKAFGNNFNTEVKSNRLSKMSIEDIKDQKQEWEQTADIVLNANRQSVANAIETVKTEERLTNEQIAEKLAPPTAKDLY